MDSQSGSYPSPTSSRDGTRQQLQSRYQILCIATLSATLTCSKPGSLAAIQRTHHSKAMAHWNAGIHSWRSRELPHLVRLAPDCLDRAGDGGDFGGFSRLLDLV